MREVERRLEECENTLTQHYSQAGWAVVVVVSYLTIYYRIDTLFM